VVAALHFGRFSNRPVEVKPLGTYWAAGQALFGGGK